MAVSLPARNGRTVEQGLHRIRKVIRARLAGSRLVGLDREMQVGFFTGKFLRSRLALGLLGPAAGPLPDDVVHTCAAVELIHNASLIHDDIIDSGGMRRGRPTGWREIGSSSAVIMGDYLFCLAIEQAAEVKNKRMGEVFAMKLREMCEGEFEQTCVCRGRKISAARCLDINRRKTGALFAIVGSVCAGKAKDRVKPLEEAGYALGTAYQIIDDLIDKFGDERTCGKTLGTDARMAKPTIIMHYAGREQALIALADELLARPRQLLGHWPVMRSGYDAYVDESIRPMLTEIAARIERTGWPAGGTR
ncbi:MAG: polyprenyl synthetase family protein [Planctomycetota bacterium]